MARVSLGTGLTHSGRIPIFRSSECAYYFVKRDIAGTGIDVTKSIDPHTESWAVQDGGNNPNGFQRVSIDCVQSGDVIHMAYHVTETGDNTYRYSSFDMSTDLWVVVDEVITTLLTATAIAAYINIGVRSDGDVVVAYVGELERVHGDDKARVDVDIRTAGPDTWSGPTNLDAAGDVHYGNPTVIKSPLTDDMHILWSRTTNTTDPPALWVDSQVRTLNPADGLSGVVTDGIDTEDKLQGWNNGISYNDGATRRIVYGGVADDATNADLVFAIGTEDASDDFQFGTSVVETVSPEPQVIGSGSVMAIAVCQRNFLHVVYVNVTDFDHYYTKSEDDGANWDTAVELEDAITANGDISLSILNYRTGYYLFWTYNDAGEWFVNSMLLYPFEAAWRADPYTVVREELR